MKPMTIVLGVAGLLLGLVHRSEAQPTERVYPFFESTDEDLARIDITDGSVGDWEEVVGEPAVTALDFHTDPEFAPYDPASMDYRIFLAWHDGTDRIYVAMQRSDDRYINEFQRDCTLCSGMHLMSRHDSFIALHIDGDHSGGPVLLAPDALSDEEEYLLGTFRQAQEFRALAEVHDTGAHVKMPHPGGYYGEDWYQMPPYAEGGGGVFGENPTISVTEFYVTPFDRFVWDSPEESLVSDLYPGKVIGFALGVTDRDTPVDESPGLESVHYLRGMEPDWNCLGFCSLVMYTSEEFAKGLLLGPGGEIPDDSAVESVTWGRIKAQFAE